MVGNDVVDLSDPDADPATRHPRFDRRAFSLAEQAQLEDEANSNALRWRLWAAKEAAYKVARKRCADSVFHPREFVVSPDSAERATVIWGRERFRVRFESSGSPEPTASGVIDAAGRRAGLVHAIAEPADEPEAVTIAGSRIIAEAGEEADVTPARQSRAARQLAAEVLSSWLGVRAADIEVRSRGRIPEVWISGVRSELDLSLSHHGRAVAFAASRTQGSES